MLGAAGIDAYPYVLALTALIGAAVFLREAWAAGIPVARVLPLIAGLMLAGHVGGRFYPMWAAGHWHWRALLELNYQHPGALAAVLLALPLLCRILLPGVSLGLLGDCVAPSLAFAMAAFRCGCLLAGCCFGTLCSLPWALRFPGGTPASMFHHAKGWIASDTLPSLPVHPLQVYFMILGVAVGAFLLRFRRRKAFDGQLLLLFLVLHESGKFLLELLRGEPRPPHNPLFSLLAAAAAAAALIAYRRRRADETSWPPRGAPP